jgi:hypothetical protein
MVCIFCKSGMELIDWQPGQLDGTGWSRWRCLECGAVIDQTIAVVKLPEGGGSEEEGQNGTRHDAQKGGSEEPGGSRS